MWQRGKQTPFSSGQKEFLNDRNPKDEKGPAMQFSGKRGQRICSLGAIFVNFTDT